MYETYWQLEQKPFENCADPRFYYPGESPQAALLKLRYAVENRRGGALSSLAMMILAPLAATLIQLAISRSREYEADSTGARITGNPQGLARALDKIDKWAKRIPLQASPIMAHLYIYQPLTTGAIFSSLFSTHPPIRKRIERLIGRDFV